MRLIILWMGKLVNRLMILQDNLPTENQAQGRAYGFLRTLPIAARKIFKQNTGGKIYVNLIIGPEIKA